MTASVLLPDRAQVTMTTHFMRSYSKLAIKTCHQAQRAAHGRHDGVYSDQESDPVANEKALRRCVRTRNARLATGTMGHGWRIRDWCRWRRRCSIA